MAAVDQKRIAQNTLMLYLRMGLITIISLYTSRVVLDALGKVDYGLYSAVGGVVTMFTFLSGTMSTACQRFFSFELGKGNLKELQRKFSQSMVVFVLIVAVVVLLCETLGLWYLENKMKLEGRDVAAHWVFHLSVIGFIFQLMRTPYMGMVIAREKMKVFAYISIFEAAGTLTMAFVLKFSGGDKLILYAFCMLGVQILVAFLYFLYCRLFYAECRLIKCGDRDSFLEVFRFTGWEMIGSLAGVCKSYGINPLLLNPFFGPAANAARGIAQKVYFTIVQLQTSFFMAVKPQIIKSYASGAVQEMVKLLCQSTRLTYYLMLIVAMPLLLETPMILGLWLKADNVPDMGVVFTRLMLVNGLIDTFSNPLASAVQATGRNKWYQICMGLTLLAILPVGYIGLKFFDWDAESVFYVSIILSALSQVIRVIFVKAQVGMSIRSFIREVAVVLFIVTVLSAALPMVLIWQMGVDRTPLQSLVLIAVSVVWTGLVSYFIGITRSERKKINGVVRDKYRKILCRQ